MVDFSKIICLLLIILPVCKSNNTTNYNKYLLPKNVLPLNYYIKLTLNLHNEAYKGFVKIKINLINKTNNITMHQNGLVILPEKVYLMDMTTDENKTIIQHDGISESKEEDFYIIHFQEELQVGVYEIVIPQYYGTYRSSTMTGLYSVKYFDDDNVPQKLIMSFFEPIYARYAFPCFDEPELKAIFKIFIIRPWNYKSASNGILINSTDLQNLLVEDEFEETPLLSTYTIAFLVSNLTLSKKVKGNVHQVLARHNLIKKNKENNCVEMAQRIVTRIGIFVKKKLHFKKIYHVAIPLDKMIFPAMENWGLITYIESNLYIANTTTINKKETIADSIIHELVHQWFGNLITLQWWNYFWLNEGLTVYLSFKITNILYPEWSKMEDLQIAISNVMKTDSDNDTVSLNHNCISPQDITYLKFNSFTFNKGAALLRMIESVLSTEIFRKGLQYYLNDREYKTVTPENLYANLDKAVRDSNIRLLDSVSLIMNTWDSQIGFPVVTARRNYGFESDNVHLTQKRCMLNDDLHPKPIWYIPINYATRGNPNFYDQLASDWLTNKSRNIKIKDLRRNDWLIINTKATYYYRVNYDLRNWDLLSKALLFNHKEIDLHNRAQIIDDAFSLASMGIIPYRIPLKISEYFYKEMEYAPLKVMKEVFDNLKVKLANTTTQTNLEIYFTQSVVAVHNSLSNRDQIMDNHIHQKALFLIFSWLCELQHPICISQVDNMFKDFRKGKALPVDLEEQLLCTAMQRGEESHWFYLFENVQVHRDNEYQRFLALACTSNNNLLERFLIYSSTLLRNNELVKAIQAVIFQGQLGFRVSLRFMILRFKFLMVRLEDNDMKTIITSLASRIAKDKDFDIFKMLCQRYKRQHEDLFKPGLVKAQENIQWNKKYLYELNVFFENYERSGTVSYHNTLGTNIFNMVMFYMGVGILY